MRDVYDIATLGSGFGGSIISLIAARRGLSVVMLDRARHPRFAIGESSTPFANLLLEHLGHRYELPELIQLSEYGRWQSSVPHLPVGLKRGFTFLQHEPGRPYAATPERENQLLVAASPNDEVADTHWFRAAFDEHLARLTQAHGVTLLEDCSITRVATGTESVIDYHAQDGAGRLRAKLIIDATGPRGALFRLLGLTERALPNLPETEALFTHFSDVAPLPTQTFPGVDLPFPPEDAAVHHLFPGGWIWALRFNNGLMSAGVSAERAVARRLRFEEGPPAWDRLLDELPLLREQFARARAVQPFIHQRRVSFQSAQNCGRGWLMLPSAAMFIDPLLSTGFPLTLLGIARVAAMINQLPLTEKALQKYAEECNEDGLAAEALVAALYRSLGDFPRFRELSMLYFAASIHAEQRVRAGEMEWLQQLALRRDACFYAELRGLCHSSSAMPMEELRDRIRSLISPIDHAGLLDTRKRNWFPFR